MAMNLDELKAWLASTCEFDSLGVQCEPELASVIIWEMRDILRRAIAEVAVVGMAEKEAMLSGRCDAARELRHVGERLRAALTGGPDEAHHA